MSKIQWWHMTSQILMRILRESWRLKLNKLTKHSCRKNHPLCAVKSKSKVFFRKVNSNPQVLLVSRPVCNIWYKLRNQMKNRLFYLISLHLDNQLLMHNKHNNHRSNNCLRNTQQSSHSTNITTTIITTTMSINHTDCHSNLELLIRNLYIHSW